MDTFKKSSAELNWRDVELSLYVLYCSGEALSKNSLQYILPNGNLTPLGELVSEMVASNISAYPHPSAPMQYFENISRYYQFFEQRPEQLPQVLESFVDARGCHHPVKAIRTRCWLLFQRFTKNLKPKMGPFVDSVLGSIGDLLTIKAELPVEASSIDDVPAASVFDNQISLFESVGLLISCDQVEPEKQAGYLKIVLEPLVEGIQKYMSQSYNPEDELFILQLHHYIMAVGAVAKGKDK
jgi:exportin-T